MKTLLLAYLAVLITVITVSSALRCYKCEESLGGKYDVLPKIECVDAFLPEGSSSPEDIEKEDCTQFQNSCGKSISQTYETGGGTNYISSYVISRGCVNSTEGLDECEEGKGGQGYQAICYCKDDLCNSATLTYVSFFLLCLSFFVALRLH